MLIYLYVLASHQGPKHQQDYILLLDICATYVDLQSQHKILLGAVAETFNQKLISCQIRITNTHNESILDDLKRLTVKICLTCNLEEVCTLVSYNNVVHTTTPNSMTNDMVWSFKRIPIIYY